MAPTVHPTFAVDKEGLAKLMSRRGPGFALLELIQNALDEASTRVDVTLTSSGRGKAIIAVRDDNPTGFANIAHAYTLFADSAKKGDVTKRGRFNLGEKLVIAICDYASVATTTGTIKFDHKGRTHHPRERTQEGSVFTGTIRMTQEQVADAIREARSVIVPEHVTLTINEEVVAYRQPLRTFDVSLVTEVADGEGMLARTKRRASVGVYAVLDGEKATIYELGIPVVATGDRWHVNVMQKVPLNIDRDNVTPAYLQDLRRAVLDACHDLLDESTSSETWINDAIEDPEVSDEAVSRALDLRFGVKRVAYDPSDPEANKIAASEGYAVIGSRSLPPKAWVNVRRAAALPAAGQVTPSPKPYSPGAENVRKSLPEDQWTEGMRTHAAFARMLASRVLGISDLHIAMVNDQACRGFGATWSRGLLGTRLEWNVVTLGRSFFDQHPTDVRALSLLIHEMGHQRGGGDHLDRRYLNELTDLGAQVTRLALAEPALFA
jgi:hypothetical protein